MSSDVCSLGLPSLLVVSVGSCLIFLKPVSPSTLILSPLERYTKGALYVLPKIVPNQAELGSLNIFLPSPSFLRFKISLVISASVSTNVLL